MRGNMGKELDKELYPEYIYPEHKTDPDEPVRESIVKLGKMMTDRIPQKLGIKKITKEDPEYWGLAGVLTDEEARIALKMGVRKPRTLAEMVKLTGMSETELEPKLQEMSVKGIGKTRSMKSSMCCLCLSPEPANFSI